MATAIPDQSATAGTAFSYAFPDTTFSDADTGDTLSYTATKTDGTALPTWLAFAAGTRTFSGTPQAADAGTVAVKVTASDGNGGSVSDTFDITVIISVPSNWSLKPTGLSTGDKFRLLFLSSTKSAGSSTDIATYNTFVQGLAAAGHADIQDYSAGFGVVGCTAAVDARDNTSTTYTTTDKGVPIYWLNGAKAADEYEDFYDGSWDDEANDKNESGTDAHDTSVSTNYPITGCNHDGTESFTGSTSRALGASRVQSGGLNSSVSNVGPLHHPDNAIHTNLGATRPLYGLSAVFEVAADTTPPTLTGASIEETDELAIYLVFSEDLQLSNPPAVSAFTVTVDGSAATVSSVLVPGSVLPQNELWLQLSTAIRQRQAVVVTYTDATSGDDTAAIQDTAGNDAATFTTGMDGVPAVTNNSTVTKTVPADWSLIPTGLSTGDKFRLLFLSSTKRNASSTDIATYNTFIQTRAAAGHTDIQDYSADFRAVGCTADTDARDNTKTTYTTTDKGVPIYWLNGAKAADQYEDFYDGSWDDEANDKNESGTNGPDTSLRVNYPWTGCDHDGTEAVTGVDSFALGTNIADARVGRPNSSTSGHGPLNGQTNRSDFENSPLYGLSGVFQVAAAVVVPNNPPTVATAIPDQSATAGTAFSYAFPANTFSDADTGDTLSYTATKADGTALPTWLAFTAGTRTFSGTPQAADIGTVAVKVTASDSNGGSGSDEFDITVAADPNAHCNALDTSELWCGTLTVGRGSNVAYGYNASLSLGSVAPRTFTHGGATITVNVLLYNGNRLGFYMSSALGAGDFSLEIGTGGAKRSFAMNNPGIEAEFFNHGLSWSANETVPVKLLLVNTPATGAPAITGTAQVGQTLTATLGDIADVDGLPDPFLTDANTSFQWIRVDGGTETNISGAMAGAYTLVADDQGTTIKVKVSFTGNNGFAETRTSAATAAVSAAATAAVVPADWSLKPTAVAAGTQFRLLFLSSTTSVGSSTDIATYNTFVQGLAAAGHADIRTYSAGFRAVGCTAAVDARDNTATTYTTTDKGVPVYWLNGAKAADQYEDFYDGSWDDEANDKNESGTDAHDTSVSTNYPITGCNHDGTESFTGSTSRALGASRVRSGGLNSSVSNVGPLHHATSAVSSTTGLTRPLYGLSAVFQVAAAVVVPNNQPAFSADTAARSVAENTAAGQNVGAALTATDADSDTLTYTLEGTDAASFDIVSGSGQIRTRTGVTYNHEAKSTHTVVVKADDGNGGTDTVTVTITVTDVDEPPGQPAAPSVSATAGSTTSLDVTWTAPTNTGPAIASYDLQYRAGTSGNFTNGPQNVTGTSAAIGSLAADTSYEVQVRATNAEGDGDWSVAGTGRTTATSAPGAPTGLTATASGTTQIDLSWSAPASTGGSAITGYNIEVSPNGTSSWTNLVANTNSTATTYAHTGLASGDTRHYRVSAINANGAGTASNVDSATTVQVPAAVSNVVAVPVPRTTDSLQVSWSAPDNAGKPALTGYDVRYREEDVNWTTVRQDAPSTSLIIAGLGSSNFYDVQVRALNADGSGPWSSTAEAVTSPRAERVYANHPLIPADLGPGDSFRLLFITRGTMAATRTGIHTYHNFASSDAIHIVEAGNLVSEWGTISLLQTPLVSTPGADARLHTDTTWTETDRGMPIYWLNGARVADDYADFYDGVWADEANPTNGLGNPHSLAGTAPWTGTDHDGTELFNGTASRAIGQASVSVGGLGSTITGAGPLNGGVIFANTQERPIYGLWHVLVVDENLRLVTNFQQLSRDASGIDARAAVRAQLFTTGPNSTGYGISSIEVVTGADTNIFLGTVALYTTDTDGNPDLADGLHATLSLERVINNYLWRLVAPEGTVLKPTTTYAMVFLGDAGTYPEPWTIDSDGEDVPADGWSLADALLYWSGTSWVENPNGRSLSMEIVGPRLETEGPALVSATVGSAGNAVTLVFDEDVVLPSDSAEALTFLASLASAFAVTADGAGVAVSGLTAAGDDSDQLTIVLSGVILQGQAVTLTYTDPTAGDDAVALQDVLGNETPTFTTGLHGVPAVINNSTITVLTTTVPGAPTGLTATASGTTAINLSWSAPASTGGSAITGYKIEVSANSTSGWTDQVADTSNTATTYAHTGLAAGDTRHYRVSAINTNGAGTASNVDSATTGTTVPGAPTGLTATASGTTAINLSWSAPASTGGSAITGYKIEVSPNGTSGWTDQVANTNSTATTYAHTGLGGGTTRHYRVSAINTNGAGTASNVDSATTGTTVPGAPTGLTATASGTTAINLSWSAPASTGGSAITGYKIEVSPNGTSGWTDQVANTNSTATTYAHTGLGGGTTRHYRVSAINTNGAGTASNVDSATTGTTVPGAPTGLTATASGTTAINLSWSAPASTGGSAITGYKIEVSPNGTSGWTDQVANTNSTATTYAHTGLGGGTTRHYRVSAINTNGAGTASNVDSATTGTTVPGAPTGLTATASGTTAINLSWSAPASTGGSAITGYKIEVSPNGTSGWTDQVANTNSTATTYAHTGLGGGTTRHYRVSAINTNGAGTASNVDSATTGTTGETTVTFTGSSYTASEGQGEKAITVELSAAPSARVRIPLAVTHLGGATAADYSGVPSSVTFAAGRTRFTFGVKATDDADADDGERVRIGFGTLPDGYAPGERPTATVTLEDNDNADLLLNFGTERHTVVKVLESDTVRHRFTLSLSTRSWGPPDGNPQQPVTIPLVVTRRGGATAADYKGIPEDVTFAVGQSVTDFFMMAIPDGKREPGEGLRLDFGPLPPGVRKGTWGPHETIEFVDQVLPGYTVLFGAEAYTATEGGADARVSIHLNEPVEIESAEVRLLLKRVGATEKDHSRIPEVVRFAVGEQTQTITVKATDDTDDDDGESVTLSFVNDPNGRVRVRTGSASATVALADNDGLRRVTVSFGAVTYTATEGGADATVRVELDAAPGRPVTVPLTKAHLGNATAADYSGIPMNVTFAANQTLRTFAVMATAGDGSDGGESVSIGFGTLPEGVFAGSPAATTVTLADGGEQRLVVNFGSNRGHTVQVREGARRLRLNVLLDSSPRRPVTIPLVVTHVGGATEADYAAIPESVTFAAGQTSAHYYVRALPDEEEETGEGLRLDFGPLPPGVRKGTWGPYETIAFVDAGQTANLSVAGLVLTLDYPWALDGGSTPSPRDFVVSAEAPGGAKDMVPVAAVSLQGSDVFLQLDRPVAPDETVTLTYLTAAMHPIRAAAGRPAAPLTDEPVLNVTGASGPLAEAGLAAGTTLPAPIATMLEAAQEGAGTERLDLSSRNLTELSALAGLSGLRELDLRHNAITDLSPLAGLTGLEVLNLSGNQIEELWPLAGLTALQRLDLSGNRIEDIATLAELTGLEVLDLSGNRIEELWPLAGLTALQRLNLSDNRIEELWPLAGLSGLQVLLLDRNRVADVLALSPLAELANLGLSGNQITDIGLLTELGRLHRLDLSGNAVADVSALGDVSGLVWLQLPGNPVSDVTPLGRLEKLLWLWLDSRTAAGMEALAPPAGRGEAQLWIEPTPAQ